MELTTTSTKAERIAFHGARKMTAQGYSFSPTDRPGIFFVLKPVAVDTEAPITAMDLEFRDFYSVAYKEDVKQCGCPFFTEHGTCKHIVWLGWKLEEDAALIAYAEQWNQEEADFDPYGKF